MTLSAAALTNPEQAPRRPCLDMPRILFVAPLGSGRSARIGRLLFALLHQGLLATLLLPEGRGSYTAGVALATTLGYPGSVPSAASRWDRR